MFLATKNQNLVFLLSTFVKTILKILEYIFIYLASYKILKNFVPLTNIFIFLQY